MINNKFGKWLILKDAGINKNQKRLYLCKCDCGLEKIVRAEDLKANKTKQCINCYRNSLKTARPFPKTHGKRNTLIYRTWASIKERCYNPNNKNYKYYGGRGIILGENWHKFENFYADMGERPAGMQIDRINNDGNYEKGNCHWVTPKENCNNRRKRQVSNESRNQNKTE